MTTRRHVLLVLYQSLNSSFSTSASLSKVSLTKKCKCEPSPLKNYQYILQQYHIFIVSTDIISD